MKSKVGFVLFLTLFAGVAFLASGFTRGLNSTGVAHLVASAEAGIQEKRFDDAMHDLANAEELDPASLSVYLTRAKLYTTQRKYDVALTEIEKAIASNPARVEGYIAKATVFVFQNNNVEAEKALKKAEDLGADDAKFHLSLGSCQLLLGKNDEALAHFRKVVEANPSMKESVKEVLATFSLSL